MNSVRVYIDENMDIYRQQGLKQFIQNLPYVVDVALSEKELHEVVVEFEARHNVPVMLIESLRSQGYHPDILSP